MTRLSLIALVYLGCVSADLEISTIEKDIVKDGSTYKCTFKLVHDDEEGVVDEAASAVTCSPEYPYSHIPHNKIELEDEKHTFMVDIQLNPDEIIRGEYRTLSPRQEYLAASIKEVEEKKEIHYGCNTYAPDNPYLTDNSSSTDATNNGGAIPDGTAAGAHVVEAALWRNGIIPYVFDYNFNQQDRLAFAKATEMITAKTCLKFQPRRGEAQYLRVIRQCHCRGTCFGGGFASLGAASPAKLTIGAVCLTPSSASGVKLVAHELLHSLGIHHTQTRPDRDSYITVMWNNIQTQPAYNYKKCPSCRIHGTPYDCMSIMHYRDWAFSTNRQPTMYARNPRTCDLKTAAYYLSAADIKLINAMYRCQSTRPVNGGWSAWSSWSTCSLKSQYKYRVCNNPKPASGGKNCEGEDKMTRACSGETVWEKHPSKDCYEGKGGTPMNPDPYSKSLSLSQCKAACLRNTGCKGIVRKVRDKNGICYLRKDISLEKCALDDEWTTHTVKSSTTTGCQYTDKNKNCKGWKNKYCSDAKWADWMSINCAKTCECGETTAETCSCSDFMSGGWGQCKKTSSSFGGSKICYVNLPSSCTDLKESKSNPGKWRSAEACSGTTPRPAITTTSRPSCEYTDKDDKCAGWKDKYCNDAKHKEWMGINCAKTCKCGETSCKYTDKSDLCSGYNQYCNHATYKEWMGKNCQKTCNCGGTTTVTPRPVNNGRYGCKSLQGYPRNLPNSHYYKRICYTSRGSLKVISANYASRAAIERTAFLIDHVMDKVDPRVPAMMNKMKFRHAVMGAYPRELTTHIPEHTWLGAWWNERARGLGATVRLPVGSSAEENAMCHRNDRYIGEDITIHEFAHSLHLTGLALVFTSFNRELTGLYNAARSYNIWPGHYAMTDFKEYFAEGVQSYFNANMANNYAPTNRLQLRQKDPNFFRFLDRYLGGNTWSRTCPSSG